LTHKLSLFFLGAVLFFSHAAQANVGAEFGMGARSAGLAGSSVAWDFDGFAGYVNPAALPLAGHDSDKPSSRFILSYGLIYMNPTFRGINNVLVENNYISTQDTYGPVDTSYSSTLGQEIGAVFKLFPNFYNLTLGVTIYFPFSQLASVDTGAALQPEYFLYRDRTQTPQLDFALGGDITSNLHFGFGLHTAYTLTGNAQTYIDTEGNPSTARFAASISPKLVPFFGILYSKSDDFSVGAVVRLPASSTSVVNVSSGAQVLGTTVPFTFDADSTLLYEPLSLELGTSFKTSETARSYVEVDYQWWSRFQAPALVIEGGQFCPNGSPQCGININPGPSYNYGYRNIVIPRVAEELTVGSTKYRVGYAYRPSILQNVSDGSGNYLDPNKHMLNLGASLEFQSFLGYDTPWRLDLNASWQYLVLQTITKTPGNEAGTLSDSKIGSPEYQAGGSVYGGGASVTFAF
jgi:hypothetical protein